MRQLTFPGFTKQYVASLSRAGTTAIYPLTREAVAQNYRLREPLLLYALANGQEKVLMTAVRNTPLAEYYGGLLQKYDYDAMISALRDQDQKGERDRRVKSLLRERILQVQQEKGVSTYRICRDLGLNNSNINCWLKHGCDEKVSLDTARRIAEFLSAGG